MRIKQDSLESLRSPAAKAGPVASQVVAAIAAVELPEVITALLQNMQTYDSDNLKVTTLQCIGYICETIVCLGYS